MSRRDRAPRPPLTLTMDRLEEKQTRGLSDGGRELLVRGAPVGARLLVRPSKGGLGLRLGVVEPAPDAVTPACPAFGRCGGCQLQEMPLVAQRAAKDALLTRLVELEGDDTVLRHAIVGAPEAYGYRNKLELSFSVQAFEGDEERAARLADPEGVHAPVRGSFLGFHPPGWFAKVVPVDGCPLGSPAMQAVIQRVSALQLGPAWDTQAHVGVWRNLVLRDCGDPVRPRLLVGLVTTSAATRAELDAVAAEIVVLPHVEGIVWIVNDGVADVVAGPVAAVLHGSPTLRFELERLTLTLPHDGFFQVNTAGAALLFGVIERALLGETPTVQPGPVLDLYCGAGVIGLWLARWFASVVGVELHPGSVAQARENAAQNGVSGRWEVGPVEEVLPALGPTGARHVVVDPPRVGLHPKAARFLAQLDADVLVYVACGPKSLARDRPILEAGGWRMESLAAVDLFPQTHHVEAVARFVRGNAVGLG